MDAIATTIKDPAWWFTAVVVGLIVGIIGSLLATLLGNWMAHWWGRRSARQRERNKARESRIDTIARRCVSSPAYFQANNAVLIIAGIWATIIAIAILGELLAGAIVFYSAQSRTAAAQDGWIVFIVVAIITAIPLIALLRLTSDRLDIATRAMSLAKDELGEKEWARALTKAQIQPQAELNIPPDP